jgi:hypothetical protein
MESFVVFLSLPAGCNIKAFPLFGWSCYSTLWSGEILREKEARKGISWVCYQIMKRVLRVRCYTNAQGL